MPTLAEIESAADLVHTVVPPTPTHHWPLLSQRTGAEVWVKHENHTPIGAFKVRGGLTYMDALKREQPSVTGVVTATRGNHGQSVALAASLYSIPSTVVVPFGNNPEKNAAMKAYGARLIEYGRDFDEAREEVARLAEAENLRFIHSANEPHLINGVGTYALEIVESLQELGPQADAVFVPIGMGSGLCGVITAFRALSPKTKIYGVQAVTAPSYYLSWKAGKVVGTETADTFADGVATRGPSEFTLEIILNGVDEIVLVSDDEIREAIRLLWRTTHNLVEGAGAAATAATIKLRDRLKGQTVVNVVSGGNLDIATIPRIFAETAQDS